MTAHRCVEEIGLVAMLATKWLAGVAPEVSRREYLTYTPPPSVSKVVHSDFEPHGKCHQKSKTHVSVAPQFFFKKTDEPNSKTPSGEIVGVFHK